MDRNRVGLRSSPLSLFPINVSTERGTDGYGLSLPINVHDFQRRGFPRPASMKHHKRNDRFIFHRNFYEYTALVLRAQPTELRRLDLNIRPKGCVPYLDPLIPLYPADEGLKDIHPIFNRFRTQFKRFKFFLHFYEVDIQKLSYVLGPKDSFIRLRARE